MRNSCMGPSSCWVRWGPCKQLSQVVFITRLNFYVFLVWLPPQKSGFINSPQKNIFFMALIFCLSDFFFSLSFFSIWLCVALIFISRTKGNVTVMTYWMWSVHSLYQPTESWLMVMESEQGKLPESNALCFASDQNNQMHLSLNRDEFCTVESWKKN